MHQSDTQCDKCDQGIYNLLESLSKTIVDPSLVGAAVYLYLHLYEAGKPIRLTMNEISAICKLNMNRKSLMAILLCGIIVRVKVGKSFHYAINDRALDMVPVFDEYVYSKEVTQERIARVVASHDYMNLLIKEFCRLSGAKLDPRMSGGQKYGQWVKPMAEMYNSLDVSKEMFLQVMGKVILEMRQQGTKILSPQSIKKTMIARSQDIRWTSHRI